MHPATWREMELDTATDRLIVAMCYGGDGEPEPVVERVSRFAELLSPKSTVAREIVDLLEAAPASGWSVYQIADRLHLDAKRVSNMLSYIRREHELIPLETRFRGRQCYWSLSFAAE